MPDFTYEARARTGALSNGTLTAGSEREAMAILDAKGLFPVRIQAAQSHAARRWGKRIKGRHLATLLSQLADLLHSGVPLLRSLEILERQSTHPTLQSVLRDVRSKVADGTGLAQAMAYHPRVFNELSHAIEQSAQNVTAGQKLADPLRKCGYFPPDVVEMIAIAEEANSLEKVLIDVADSLEKRTGRQLDLFVRLLEPMMLLVMAAVTLLVVAGLLLPVFKMGSTVNSG